MPSGLTAATAFFIDDASVRTTAGSSWRQGGVWPCRLCGGSSNCGRHPRRNSQQRPLDSVRGVPAGSRCSGNGPTAAAGVAGGGIGGGGGGLSEEDVPLVEVKATEGGDSIYSLRESAPTRRGKWSRLEEEYAKRVVRDFEEGVLDAPAGAGLRKLLASKLGCDLMRVSKKFSGWACVGRRGFQPVRHPDGRASRRGSSTKSAARSPPLPPVADAGGNMKEEQRDSNTAAPARPWSAARGQHSPTRDSSPGAIHPPEKEVPPSNGGGGGGSRSVGLSPCRGNRETAERDGEEPREEETNGRELSPPQQPQPQPQPLPSSPPWEGNAGRGQPVGRHGNENGHCRWTAPSSVPSSPHDSSCRTGGRAPPRKHEGVYLRRSERSRSPPDISSPSWPSPRERVSRETADGGDMCTVFPGRGGEDRRTAAMVVAAQPATNEGNNNAAGLVARRLSSGGVGGSGVGGGSGGGDSGWPPDPSATAGHEEMDRSREQASRSRQQLRRFSTGCAPFRLKPATLPPHFGMEDHEQQMFLPLGATDNQAVEFMTVGPPPPPQQQRRQERSREGCGYPHRVEEETSPPWWAKTGLPAGTRIHPQHHRSAKAPRMMGCFLRDSTYGSGGDYYSGHDNDNSDYSGHREQQPRRQQWWALSQADSPGRTGRTAVAANSSNHGWQQYAHSGGGAFSGNGGNGGGGGIRAAELEGVHRIGSGPPAACGGTPPTIAYNSHDRSSSLRLSTRPFPETTQWRSNVRANVAPRVRGRGGAAAYQQDWATFGSSVTGRRVECVYRREAEEDEVCGYVCLR
ncbi:conserved unknown protein [Ectocarpus siliculosus]|uniref:Uncharacterized protein n=1 Tax=Ectocarpus siliculosus TaxID=2880 RepID=D8LM17_ECTSI|nr:conserved unknown protein [Ectocarpus siliculosus]|eukprot:CBN77231.1 conserved unknown protein [Ectocarpus siliculosus]